MRSTVQGAAFLLVLCVLSAFLGTSCADEPTSPVAPTGASSRYTSLVISGTVTDTDDRPLAGAVVTHPSNGLGVTTPGRSGPDGAFSVTFEVSNSDAGRPIAVPFVGVMSDYEGPWAFAEIQNLAVVNAPLRLRLQAKVEVGAGSSFSGSLLPNHPDWRQRGSLKCPCFRVHVRPSSSGETRIRLTSTGDQPLRVGASAQNSPDADPYEEAAAFFRQSGSLDIDGGTAVSEIVVPAGFIYGVIAVVGRPGEASDMTSPAPFMLSVE